jgi:hypothetical protein
MRTCSPGTTECPIWALPLAAHRFFSDEKRILYTNGSVEFYSTYPGVYDP